MGKGKGNGKGKKTRVSLEEEEDEEVNHENLNESSSNEKNLYEVSFLILFFYLELLIFVLNAMFLVFEMVRN